MPPPDHIGYVYILTNDRKTVLYTGVTSNLLKRVQEHKQHLIPGFTKKYHLHLLVYFEQHHNIESAITREKQIKGITRRKKDSLIESMNKDWRDLSEEM